MRRQDLIKKAEAQGYEVRGDILGRFHKRTGRCLLGVVMHEDGTYTRADVPDLSVCTKMSSKEVAKLLGVKP